MLMLLYIRHAAFFFILFFFFNNTPTTEIYTLSLHDALPISLGVHVLEVTTLLLIAYLVFRPLATPRARSEEHTSELQSRGHLVCRLLLEKKKKNINMPI